MSLVTKMVNIDKKGYCIIKKEEKSRLKLVICYTNCLKLARDNASFPPAARSFQASAPLKEKHSWSVFELFLGSCKSVSVFPKHLEVTWDALVN